MKLVLLVETGCSWWKPVTLNRENEVNSCISTVSGFRAHVGPCALTHPGRFPRLVCFRAGPLKAKMVSYKLSFVPSVSSRVQTESEVEQARGGRR